MNPPDNEEPFIGNDERQARELEGDLGPPGQNVIDLVRPSQEPSEEERGNPKSSIMLPKVQGNDK